jgi:monoamine oxidase
MLAHIKGGGLDKYWTETEVFRCEQGNDALAKRLASAVGQERIHLDHAVEQIVLKDSEVVVRTAKGNTYIGDQVVLAIPPSVWSKIKIEPALPAILSP